MWLVKTDPDEYSWSDFYQDGSTVWDGVKNYQAIGYLKEMKLMDEVLIYHSFDKYIAGLAVVEKEFYILDGQVVVDLRAVREFPSKVSLHQIKQLPSLSTLFLVRQSRLSVGPVNHEQREILFRMIEQGQ
ncbi:MAG: 3-phosphoshikimate 1-carboxyvinyltransferase [Candidatus Xenolissoclinum pacificiensis L6]|uniref:3-phosphoshikimate 1-carboxyvinyltransferase n=1 Tax=Candidatus Xenolissoclinum pacificiensis L6 TaxID=1401685 RepID=W2UZH3_9RICK|nr:MAG: 3-phosphoshikimate 1-carboxyvinyltransferase [Candidatus Xenolissoclinum pacificiensis L6]